MPREPGYRLHKPTGQAYVNLSGRMFYLGKHGTPESVEKYERLKAEWLVNRHAGKFAADPSGPTVAQVCLAYLDHAKTYYHNGTECVSIRLALQPLSELYATLPAVRFGVLEYRTVLDWWLRHEIKPRSKAKPKTGDEAPKPPRKCTRQYINSQMKRVLRMLRWAVGQGMLSPSVVSSLECVGPLRRGRTAAPEARPITCVDQSLVDATLPFLTKVVRDMVRFQQLTGCRPGEVCKIKPSMVNRSGEVWTISLNEHKTAHRGKKRTIYVGPQAQRILTPYLLRASDAYCFSPIESERQRQLSRHEMRVTSLSCGNRPGTNRVARKPRTA
ncbi:MAG: tyrosine-type recombinase/integrase, partial [Aureliella sp.]